MFNRICLLFGIFGIVACGWVFGYLFRKHTSHVCNTSVGVKQQSVEIIEIKPNEERGSPEDPFTIFQVTLYVSTKKQEKFEFISKKFSKYKTLIEENDEDIENVAIGSVYGINTSPDKFNKVLLNAKDLP